MVLLNRFKGKPSVQFLELGSWKGRSAIWLAENILTGEDSQIHCVDTWDVNAWDDGNPSKERFLGLQAKYRTSELHDIFLRNTASFGDKIVPHRMSTTVALEMFAQDGKLFDFIYIDADHGTEAVMSDFEGALKCIKENGIIFFDDVKWAVDGVAPVSVAITQLEERHGIIVLPIDENGSYYQHRSV
jgi:predicted O-methyltransferase YrrM